MPRPRHRRCQVCHQVTARYSRTTRQGAFTVQVWERDARGEVFAANGRQVWCREHAPSNCITDTTPSTPADSPDPG